MPSRKRSRSSSRALTRRRPYKRYRRKYPRYRSLRAPLPKRLTTKLRYYFEGSFNNSVAGVPLVNVFSCNGIHDPDISGVGHQPRGRDQIHPLYDHHIVLGSKMTVRLLATEGSDTIPTTFGIAIRDSVTEDDDTGYNESGKVHTNVISGAKPSSMVTMKVNPAKFLGRSRPLSDPDLKGSTSSNPVEQCYFHLFAYAQEASAGTKYYNGYIDYIVCFVEPRQPGQS